MDFRSRYKYNPKEDLLGKGGFSRVFKAVDVLLDREVALKVFNSEQSQQYDLISEIKKVIKFHHENLCRYYDVAILETVTAFGEEEHVQVGVMEFLDGGELKKYLVKNPQYLDKLLADVLKGLSYLHKKNIIHRDLKPQNILIKVEEDGPVAKITDFGISKALDTLNDNNSALMGTVEYMAPEQFNPQKYGLGGQISTQLDLWSFGIMVFELIRGENLFGSRSAGTSAEIVMSNILGEDYLDKIKILPSPYDEIVRLCVIKKAADRVKSADDLLDILAKGSSGARPAIAIHSGPVSGNFSDETIVLPSGTNSVSYGDETQVINFPTGTPVNSQPAVQNTFQQPVAFDDDATMLIELPESLKDIPAPKPGAAPERKAEPAPEVPKAVEERPVTVAPQQVLPKAEEKVTEKAAPVEAKAEAKPASGEKIPAVATELKQAPAAVEAELKPAVKVEEPAVQPEVKVAEEVKVAAEVKELVIPAASVAEATVTSGQAAGSEIAGKAQQHVTPEPITAPEPVVAEEKKTKVEAPVEKAVAEEKADKPVIPAVEEIKAEAPVEKPVQPEKTAPKKDNSKEAGAQVAAKAVAAPAPKPAPAKTEEKKSPAKTEEKRSPAQNAPAPAPAAARLETVQASQPKKQNNFMVAGIGAAVVFLALGFFLFKGKFSSEVKADPSAATAATESNENTGNTSGSAAAANAAEPVSNSAAASSSGAAASENVSGKVMNAGSSSQYTYTGTLKNGKPEGKGVQTFQDGSSLSIGFSGGKPNGKASFVAADGSKYDLTFSNGKGSNATGTFADGGNYKGPFVLENGKVLPNGKGSMTWENGDKYVGVWARGKKTSGTFYYRDGALYKGTFVNDKRDGKGKYMYADGSYYEGEFSGDDINGNGSRYNSSGELVESGVFKNGKLIK